MQTRDTATEWFWLQSFNEKSNLKIYVDLKFWHIQNKLNFMVSWEF